jgi:hypothetical protein
MGKSTISTEPFSIAMLNYQRVHPVDIGKPVPTKAPGFDHFDLNPSV